MNDKWLTINFERYGRDKKDQGGMGKVVVALPELKPGEYRPAVILKGDEKKVYVLPMRWVVRGRWRR